MEATISQLKTPPNFSSSSFPTPKTTYFSPRSIYLNHKLHKICQKSTAPTRKPLLKLNCAKGCPVSELENELNMEEEYNGIKKLNGKCKETVGLVELLECLEKEAIMGEDKGRDAKDYNRRALIFDKSDKVFQALNKDKCTSIE